MPALKDIKTGQKFNKLTVIKMDHTERYKSPKGKNLNKKYYLCKCECGNTTIVYQGKLLSGQTKSCGCLQTKHGKYKSSLYNIWRGMKKRCDLTQSKDYKNYGGRGISVCQDWENDFKSFYDWSIKNGYQEGLTIDRKNNDGNYCQENCRWVSMKEQARNKRSNVIIEIDGEKKNITDWAEHIGVKRHILYWRFHNTKDIIQYIKNKEEEKWKKSIRN